MKNTADFWLSFLTKQKIPIFLKTKELILNLDFNDSKVDAIVLAKIVLHDPLLTLIILKYVHENPNKLRVQEITTIEHAIMMIGFGKFFQLVSDSNVVENYIEDHDIYNGLKNVVQRSVVASKLAKRWASEKKDMITQEIQVAALIHDFPEMLLWMFAPEKALRIKHILEKNPNERSAAAQTEVLGFPLVELQYKIIEVLNMPPLFQELILDKNKIEDLPKRIQIIAIAIRLARHSQKNWDNPALPDDWDLIFKIINNANKLEIKNYIDGIREEWISNNSGNYV